MLARKLLNSPGRPGVALPSGDDLVADALQIAQAQVAAILDDQLESAGRSQAIDRRAPKIDHDGVAHLAVTCSSQFAAIASAERSARAGAKTPPVTRTSSPDSAHWRPRSSDWPAMPTVCATPGVSRAMLSIWCHHLLRPLDAGRVGQLHVQQQIALVLLRDEAGRHVLNRTRSAPSNPP